MGYAIRAATAQDVCDMAEVHRQSWRHTYRGIVADSYLDTLTPDRWNRSFSDNYDTDGQRKPDAPRAYVLEAEGVVVGVTHFAAARDEGLPPDTGEIISVYFLPDYCGRGYGGALIHFALAQLREMGFVRCVVWTFTGNTVARAVYERYGFAPDGATGTITIEGQDLEEMRYVRALKEET